MKIQKKKSLDVKSVEAVVIPIFKNRAFEPVIEQDPEIEFFLKKFKAAPKESIVINSNRLSRLLVVVGAGEVTRATDAAKCAAKIISITRDHLLKNMGIHFLQDIEIPRSFAITFIDFLYINHYRFDHYLEKKEQGKKIKKVHLVFDCQDPVPNRIIRDREIINHNLIMVRDLVNEIPEKLNPDTLVEAFTTVSKKLGLDLSVMRQTELEEQDMMGIISVGRASPYQPALIRIEYSPEIYKKTVTVVGKGITFDSGGLNIKVGTYMREMKCDMAGAATVLGIIKAAAELNLPVRIIALAGIAENMPGHQAYKPGDIIAYRNKKTVEVVNTDAEGRLVLADTLIQAVKDKPDYIVEFSTLTGAMLVALGDMIAGVMCNHKKFTRLLEKASEKTCDFLWEMPLFEEYRESIKSKIAHLKNADYQGASPIKAGLFLNEFTDNIRFAHIDFAGTAFLTKANAFYHQPGATGFGLRLVIEFMNGLR
jgi:leucyl aminopeptidase